MLKNIKKYITITVIICLLLFSVIFIGLGIKSSHNIKPIYNYKASKDSDYEVSLKANDFYETETLPADNYYISKSVDKYLLNFKYDFKSDKNENIKYRYNITADLVGTISNNNELDKEVWKKTFTLLNDKNSEINQDGFAIAENVEINYDYYNNLVHDFEEYYGISINAILKVKFNIFYDINLDDIGEEGENVEDNIELDIAIADNITNIEKNYEPITEKNLFAKSENINITQVIYYVISGVLIIIAIALIIKIAKNKKTPEELYRKNINYILKNYGELIVTVTNEPKLDGYTIMNVSKLEDLIDLAEQNKINIIHYESIKDKQSDLYVIIDKLVYIYNIKVINN